MWTSRSHSSRWRWGPPDGSVDEDQRDEGELNMVAWEGYLDAQWVKPFQTHTGCNVNAKYAGSSDEMVTLMRSGGGGQYDMVSASGDASLRLIYGGDVAASTSTRCPGTSSSSRRFQSPPNNTVKGKHYGISLQWGPNTVLYNTKKVKPAPTSVSVMYSPKYQGKITVPNNPIQIADAALYLSKTNRRCGSPILRAEQDQFNAAIALLKKQRPLVKKYWGLASDEISLFKNGDVVLGASWPYTTGRSRTPRCRSRRSSRAKVRRAGSTRGCSRRRRSIRTARTPGYSRSRARRCRPCRRSPTARRR